MITDHRPPSPEGLLTQLGEAPTPVEALRPVLAERALAGGVLDVVYAYLPSPLGTLLLAATPAGITRLAFEHERHVLEELAVSIGPRILEDSARLEPAQRQLEEYFRGQRTHFSVPLDLRVAGFRRTVIEALPEIGYGTRLSYKDLAARVGNPGAVRAVGSACANNPIPILLPCHRVVRSDGTWGNYRGGPEAKTRLLDLEAA